MKTLFLKRTVLAVLLAAVFALFSYARLLAQVEEGAAEPPSGVPEEMGAAGEPASGAESAAAEGEIAGAETAGPSAAEEDMLPPPPPDEEIEGAPAAGAPEMLEEETFLSETESMLPVEEEESQLEITDSGNVTIDFVDADIKDVLRAFSFKTGVNVVAGDEITGSVTIRLVNVPWEQALRLILEAKSYAYVQEGNVVKVMTQEAMQNEPIETEVIRLKYAKAGDIAQTVQQVLKDRERGAVQFDDRSNALIISDVRSNMSKISEIITILDTQTPQVSIEAKIIETGDEAMKDLGINWTSLSAYTIQAGGLQRVYKEERTDAKLGSEGVIDLGVSGNSESRFRSDNDLNSSAYSSTAGFDGLNNTYSSSRSRSTSGTDSLSYNSSRSSASTSARGAIKGTGLTELAYDAEKGELKMQSVIDSLITDTRTAVLSASDFAIVLSALQQDNDAKLISNPTVVVSDNQDAEITIGEQYPIPQYRFNEDTATLEVSGFEFIDIGVILRVTPHINPDGYVTLDVQPEVSTRGESVPFGGSVGTEIPIIKSRRTRTRVILKDGYTLTIGGLISEDELNQYTKVPLVGDIPVVGQLFKHKSLKKITRNITIFLTTRLVSPDSGTPVAEETAEPQAGSMVAAAAAPAAVPAAAPAAAASPGEPAVVGEVVPAAAAETPPAPAEPVAERPAAAAEPTEGDQVVPAGFQRYRTIGGVRR